MKWNCVEKKLPRANSDILMAWADERAVRQGKFFGKDCGLHGFAESKGSHYVGKIGVTHWCYLKDALPAPAESGDV